MTTGIRVADYRYKDAYGRKTLGLYKSRSWNGGDWSISIAAAVRRRVLKQTRPESWYDYKAAHAKELFDVGTVTYRKGRRTYTVPDSKEIIRRHHDLYRVWAGKLRVWQQSLKEYHAWKAAWKARDEELHPYTASIQKTYTTPAFISSMNGPASKIPESPVSSLGYPSIPSTFSMWGTEDDNATIEKFREKLTNIKGFHAGVSVAEFEKTLRMIADNSKALRRFGQRLKKGDIPGALRVLYNGTSSAHINGFAGLSRGAQQYLAYQFGLKPLVMDMEGAGQFIGYTQFQTKTMRVRATRKQERGFGDTGAYKRPGMKTVGMRIVAHLKSVPSALDLSGLLDVPSILWERLMFSFVIDWWFKIGQALQAMQMARKLEGTFVKTRYEKVTMGAYQSGTAYRVDSDSSQYLTVEVSRTIVKELIVKLPNLRPIFHPDTDVRLRHATEAIALLVVNKKRISKGVNWLRANTRQQYDYTE